MTSSSGPKHSKARGPWLQTPSPGAQRAPPASHTGASQTCDFLDPFPSPREAVGSPRPNPKGLIQPNFHWPGPLTFPPSHPPPLPRCIVSVQSRRPEPGSRRSAGRRGPAGTTPQPTAARLRPPRRPRAGARRRRGGGGGGPAGGPGTAGRGGAPRTEHRAPHRGGRRPPPRRGCR